MLKLPVSRNPNPSTTVRAAVSPDMPPMYQSLSLRRATTIDLPGVPSMNRVSSHHLWDCGQGFALDAPVRAVVRALYASCESGDLRAGVLPRGW